MKANAIRSIETPLGGRGRLAAAALALAALTGCPAKHLRDVMREYGFAEIRPPQTAWEPGSIVEIDDESAPVLRITPSAAKVASNEYESAAPDVERKHGDRLELALGLSLPLPVRASLTVQGAREYSVVARGNVIRRILIDEYALGPFAELARRYGANWAAPIADEKLHYLHELWCADTLEYRFYGKGGAEVGATLSGKVPVEAKAGFSWDDQGSLVHSGQGKAAVCLGYKARRIRAAPQGGIVPEAAGKDYSAHGPEAATRLYQSR